MEKTPMDVRMYMIDPKRVELTPYEGLPHVSGPILVEVEDSVPTLKSILLEMDSRYKKFARVGAKKIVAYNEKFSDATERLPYILIIIDELADLMMTAQAEVESTLVRLAQLGRATGIHLIVATQRPSVDILTGTIKANFPSRISFAVPSQIDSRTILDAKGAEKLLGKGDMLYLPGNASKPKRLQGGFISDEEVQDIVIHWKQQHSSMPKLAIPISKIQLETSDKIALDSEAKEIDQDLAKAINLAKNHSRISAPLIQRKLGIGFTKASNLLSQLEDKGLVETGDPGKSRKVLIIEN
jgi:S-DNA-T family DNA segregation ATPase FtsK/SpoIIIE